MTVSSMCVRDFHKKCLKEKQPISVIDRLEYAGYHSSILSVVHPWHSVHLWCMKQYGQHYTYTGNIFWFNRPQDALLFSLAWGR
jgi:hypothetical protein